MSVFTCGGTERVRIQIYKHTTVICTEYRTHGAEYTTHGARGFMISKHATPPTSPTAAASANRHIVRIARRILRRAPLGRFPLRRVHSQEDERGDGDIRRHGLARRRARRQQTYNSNLYRVQNSWGRVHDSWGSRLYDLEARDSADVAYCRRLSESPHCAYRAPNPPPRAAGPLPAPARAQSRGRAWRWRHSAPWSSASPCSSPTGTDDALLRLPERVAEPRDSTGSS